VREKEENKERGGGRRRGEKECNHEAREEGTRQCKWAKLKIKELKLEIG
jgi:hypothetical protein